MQDLSEHILDRKEYHNQRRIESSAEFHRYIIFSHCLRILNLNQSITSQINSIKFDMNQANETITFKRNIHYDLKDLIQAIPQIYQTIQKISEDVLLVANKLQELDTKLTNNQIASENKSFEKQKNDLESELLSEEQQLDTKLKEFETQIREIQIRETIYENQIKNPEQDPMLISPIKLKLSPTKNSKSLAEVAPIKPASKELEDFLNF